MRDIRVSEHVLKRWPERLNEAVDAKQIKRMFRNNKYTFIEPAKDGRLIIELKGYVLVISKTNTGIIVHTVYGKIEDYKVKRPHAVDDVTQIALDKWERQYYYKNVLGRKGAR